MSEEPSKSAGVRQALGVLVFPFWSSETRRLRALVRVFLQLVVLLVISLSLHLLFGWLYTPEAASARAILWNGAAFSLSTVAAAAVSVLLAARFLDRRPLAGLGLRLDARFWLDLVFGFALGALLMLGVLGAEVAFDWASYREAPASVAGWPRYAFLPVALLVFVAVAFGEELVSRGYHLTNLAEGFTCRFLSPEMAVLLATVVSSAAFGVAHVFNPHASAISTGNIMLAGIMLSLGYVLTGKLAIPFGLHLSWNLFQNLFGMPVSGQTRFFYGAVVTRSETGPDWITGGSFGPEAGMTGLCAIVVGTLLIGVYVRVVDGPLRVAPSLTELPPRLRERFTPPPEA